MPDASDPEDEIFSGQALSEDGSLASGNETKDRPGPSAQARTTGPRVPSRPAIAPPEPEPPKLEPVFDTKGDSRRTTGDLARQEMRWPSRRLVVVGDPGNRKKAAVARGRDQLVDSQFRFAVRATWPFGRILVLWRLA